MENKKKRNELSYNPQITVDHDSGIIVENDVTQDCTDYNQLQPQLEKTQDIVGKLSEETKVSVDNGYFTGDYLRFLEEMGSEGYIPDASLTQEMKGKKRNNDPYSKDKFEYDIAGKGKMRPITSDEYEAESGIKGVFDGRGGECEN